MKRIVFSVIVVIFSLQVSSAQKLVILHTNDTHSQIETAHVGYNNGLGGVERRLQIIDRTREEYGPRNVLLLDAGDFNQGTPYYTVCQGELEMDLVNALGYDAITLGNHEFDNGLEHLAARLCRAKFPVLSCNYDFSKTPLAKIVKPYTIIRRGGMKIGIVGASAVLDGFVAKSCHEGTVRLNTLEEVNRYASFLKNEKKCDLVILLSHLGFDGRRKDDLCDIYLAENTKDVDIIIGGHSHTFLKEAREVKNLEGRTVPVVQSGGQGAVVGKFEIF